MMRSFRGLAKPLMFIMAFTFLLWLVFDVGADITGRGTGGRGQPVAKVNGTTIDQMTYQTALQTASEQRSRQGGAATTLEDQQALGDQVLDELVREILLNQELKRRDLKVTEEEIIAAAMNSPPPELEQAPEFQTDGRFDMNKYRRYLSTNPEEFMYALETRYRSAIPQNKLVQELASTVYVPTPKLWRMYQDQHDSVTATFALLQPESYISDSVVRPTDAELQAYYRAHREDFRRPAVAYLSFVQVPRVANASDSAAARDTARAVWQRVTRGGDFAAIAREVSGDSASAPNGGDLGEVKDSSMIPVFERAALALRPGQISQPVLSPFGYHIIKLESRDARKRTYRARHILIPVDLAGEHRDEVESRADSLDRFAAEQDDRWALDSVGRRMRLAVSKAPPLIDGNRLQLGRFVIPDVHVWAFSRNPGESSPVIESDHAYYVFRLDSLEEEGIPPFERVSAEVRRALVKEQKSAAARTVAQQISQEIKAGARLRTVADRLRISVTTLGPFTRGNPPFQVADALPVIGAAFGLGVGQIGGPYETESGIYFVEPIRKRPADSSKFVIQLDTLRMQVLQLARRDRVQQVLASLREEAKVEDRRKELEKAAREAEELAANQPQPPGGMR